jgi:hypothetical protein
MPNKVKDMRKMAKEIFEDRKLKKSMVFSGDQQGEIMVVYCGVLQVGTIPFDYYMKQIQIIQPLKNVRFLATSHLNQLIIQSDL